MSRLYSNPALLVSNVHKLKARSVQNVQLNRDLQNQMEKGFPLRAKVIANCQPNEWYSGSAGTTASKRYGADNTGWFFTGTNHVLSVDNVDYELGIQSLKSVITGEDESATLSFLPNVNARSGYPYGQSPPLTIKNSLLIRMKVKDLSDLEYLRVYLYDAYGNNSTQTIYATIASRTESDGIGSTYRLINDTWQWVVIPASAFSQNDLTNQCLPWGWGKITAASSNYSNPSTTIVLNRYIADLNWIGSYILVNNTQYLITSVSGTPDIRNKYNTIVITGNPSITANTTVITIKVPQSDFPVHRIQIRSSTRTVGNGYTNPVEMHIQAMASVELNKALVCLQLDEPYQSAIRYLTSLVRNRLSWWPIDLNVRGTQIGNFAAGSLDVTDLPMAYSYAITNVEVGDTFNVEITLNGTTDTISFVATDTTDVNVVNGLIAALNVKKEAGTYPWSVLTGSIRYADQYARLQIETDNTTDTFTTDTSTVDGGGTDNQTIVPTELYMSGPTIDQLIELEKEGHGINHHGRVHYDRTYGNRESGVITCDTSADGLTVTTSDDFFLGIQGYDGDKNRTIKINGASPDEAVIDSVIDETTCTLKTAVQGSISGATFRIVTTLTSLEYDLDSVDLRSFGLGLNRIIPNVLPQNSAVCWDTDGNLVDALPVVKRCSPITTGLPYTAATGYGASPPATDIGCIPQYKWCVNRRLIGGDNEDDFNTPAANGYTGKDRIRYAIEMGFISIHYAHNILPTPAGSGNVSEEYILEMIDYLANQYFLGNVDFVRLLDIYHLWGNTSNEIDISLNGLLYDF